MVETAADIMAKDLPELPVGSKEFWCAYEIKNGGIGTWCGYAMNADEFVESVVNGIYGDIVKKFTEIHQHNDPKNYFGGYIDIPVRKYNKFLRNRWNPIVIEDISTFPREDRVSEVHLILASYSIDGSGDDEKICLSSHCVTYSEVDYWLKRLERNIRQLRAEAKLMFAFPRKD